VEDGEREAGRVEVEEEMRWAVPPSHRHAFPLERSV